MSLQPRAINPMSRRAKPSAAERSYGTRQRRLDDEYLSEPLLDNDHAGVNRLRGDGRILAR